MIIEYKKHRNIDGSLTNPSWVEPGMGGAFPFNNTFIAQVPNDSDRAYYIPDTVVEINKEDLIARVKNIGITRFEDGESVLLTDEEIIQNVENWLLKTGYYKNRHI